MYFKIVSTQLNHATRSCTTSTSIIRISKHRGTIPTVPTLLPTAGAERTSTWRNARYQQTDIIFADIRPALATRVLILRLQCLENHPQPDNCQLPSPGLFLASHSCSHALLLRNAALSPLPLLSSTLCRMPVLRLSQPAYC